MNQRCFWVKLSNPLYVSYHDEEWGVPIYDDRELFEKLCLDGAQAGLSWETILNKRENYRKAFFNFDPVKMAKITPAQEAKLLQNPGIVRNRLKVKAFKKNAEAYLKYMKEEGSFSEFLWGFVGGAPIQNKVRGRGDIKATSPESDAMSKALKKLGFTFVGSTICYAFMQAVGMVNDHSVDCPRHKHVKKLARK
jgi:DNA-3-methyladenine glycosylase I